MNKNILVIGGTGFIGSFLCKKLTEKGYNVSVLSRKKTQKASYQTFTWDVEKSTVEIAAIQQANYIINLSGENIGEKRWTKKRKQSIVDSRIKTSNLIFDYVKKYNPNIKAYISASAVGYYGAITSNYIFKETDAAATDFLGNVCEKWENASDNFLNLHIRVVKIRTGLVLAAKGGVIDKLKIPVTLGVGFPLGSGKQYVPWIHISDLCNMYIKAIEDEQMAGAYNAVSSEHIQNKDFIKQLAKSLKKPFWNIFFPEFFFSLLLGEMSVMITKGSRISNEKIKKTGFCFEYEKLIYVL